MRDSEQETYIDISDDAGAALFSRDLAGEIVLLNMLRFRETADYSNFPELAPDTPISGERAYTRYGAHVLPLLQAAGGAVIYSGTGGEFLIGPSGITWDLVLLVRHQSLQAFRSFATNPEYLAGVGHRTAALRDSRLLPLIDTQ